MAGAIATVGLFHEDHDYNPEELLADVSVDERHRYQALRRPQRARQYLASRWLLRQHLAAELAMKPAQVPLRLSDHGPPALTGLPHALSLGHSHALCLCIVSRQADVGCDIEHHHARRHDVREIAAHYFHPSEAAQLEATSETQRLSDFHRLWTLKEAGRKALGQGIAGGLRTPAFSLRPTFQCLNSHDRTFWTFAAGNLACASGQYSLALAIRTCLDRITIYRYRPDGQAAARQPLDMNWELVARH